MPMYEIVQREGYKEVNIVWAGLTLEEEKMANKILRGIHEKQKTIVLHYKDNSVNHICRSSGEIWLNNNEVPFDSGENFDAWLEKEVPEIEKALKRCDITGDVEDTIIRE